MTTYDGAYSNKSYQSATQSKVIQKFTVAYAKFVDSHHYHGSWFEYTWELGLIDEQSKTVKKTLDTWTEYKMHQLIGKEIKYDGNVFSVI